MKEIFKDIEGYNGNYQVSNLGNIKSFKLSSEKILKGSKTKNGYLKVDLCKDSIKKSIHIHLLVAIAFLNHKPDGHNLVVDHKNDIKSDNRLLNLQIITQRQNSYKSQGKYSSKYKGVHWCKNRLKWKAAIRINNKLVYLGLFDIEQEASEAYQNKLKTL